MSTQGNTSKHSSGHGAGTEKKWRDEEKLEKIKKAATIEMIKSGEFLLKQLINTPNYLEKPEFHTIRKYLLNISKNHASYLSSPTGWGAKREELTKDIASNLQNRDMPSTLEKDIVLQITHSDGTDVKKGASIGISGQGKDIGTRQNWKFTAVDGSNQALLLRIDSTLNTRAMSLDPGSIAKITSSFPVYFNYEDSNDTRCAIVIKNFEIIGKRDVPEDLLMGGGSKKVIKQKKRKAMKMLPTTGTDPSEKEQPCCDGSRCSKHGVSFDLCLCQLIPPDAVPLPIVARECVFTTMEVKDMQPNHKRFLLYYYYATTIYQFHGAGNRVELPECVIYAVRKLFPSEVVDMTDLND